MQDNSPDKEPTLPVIGISACLAGQTVRYNGGHSQSRLCLNQLSRVFTFETFCPEVAAGFGTPRPTMRLAGQPDNPRLIFSDGDPGQPDLAAQLRSGFDAKLDAFAHLDGYILMKNSPSCGLERVKVYQDNGYPHEAKGMGIFAKALQQRYPLMPLEEEGRLHDAHLRENFILRVYTHHRFHRDVLDQLKYSNLLAFHSRYKYLLMAHSQTVYRQLGQLLASAHDDPLEETAHYYFEKLMQALSRPAGRSGNTNALLHLLGYLKKSVNSEARQDLAHTIHRYRCGEIPLVTPVTMLNHYINQVGSHYVKQQIYWQPYPDQLGLRNQL